MEFTTKIFVLVNLLFLSTYTHASTIIPAIFAFGDSILDPGNNNVRSTITRSDHAPYGYDFPNHVATGRFSNGKLTTDILVSELGLKPLLPAYLNPIITDQDLLTGVSFASAGTGLDDLTATETDAFTFSDQLEFFDECLQRIRKSVATEEANHIVENAVIVIAVGTNDFLFNFYLLKTRKVMFSISDYHDFLLKKFEVYLTRMYSMGARRFAVSGLPPIGCLPLQITNESIKPSLHMLQRVCVTDQNVDAENYNIKLQTLLDRLQTTLPRSRFAYVDAYNVMLDMITKPANYGFQQTLKGCCGTGTVELSLSCNLITPICKDSSEYVFWDAVHPTEAAYKILATSTLQNVLPLLLM